VEPALEQRPRGGQRRPGAELIQHAGTKRQRREPAQESRPVDQGEKQRQVDEDSAQQASGASPAAGKRWYQEQQGGDEEGDGEEQLQGEHAAKRGDPDPPRGAERDRAAGVDPRNGADEGARGDAGDEEPGQSHDEDGERDLGDQPGAVGQPLGHPGEVGRRPPLRHLEVDAAASATAARRLPCEEGEEPEPGLAAEDREGPRQQVLVAHRLPQL